MRKSKCYRCIHINVCPMSTMKTLHLDGEPCENYKRKHAFSYLVSDWIAFQIALLGIKWKECKHFCFNCPYKEECHLMIKAELKQI